MLFGSVASNIQARACAAGLPGAVFLAVALLLVPAFVLTLLVEEMPLRAQGGLAAAHADADTEQQLSASRADTAVL